MSEGGCATDRDRGVSRRGIPAIAVGARWVGALLLLLSLTALAHEVRPAYLELRETTDDSFEVLWKVPMRGEMRLALSPHLPGHCETSAPVVSSRTGEALIQRWKVRCDGGLADRRLVVEGLQATLTEVLVRIQRTGGPVQVERLTPATTSLIVAEAPSRLDTIGNYTMLGIEHILMGIDHLLFVLGLLLIVKDRMALLKTVTAFTIAHSITLAIATLGYASVPLPPLNACIALSILFLGPEIVRAARGQTSLTIRFPWIVAFLFGLLHGFGFASGLSSTGMPRAELPLALLLFNVGVEVGQLAFVFLALALAGSFKTLEVRWPPWIRALPAYTVGGLGAYWTMQRTVILLGVL
mgnify:CR=1 FL=1